MEEETIEPEPWYKGPIKYIMGIFLVLLIVLMVVPRYAVKLDPSPNRIPELGEVLPLNITILNNSVSSRQDFLKLVQPNDPVIKQVADKVASIACDGQKVCQAKAIYHFVRDNFDYVSDPNRYEYVKSARESLVSGGGDCDDSSVLLANLMEAIGIKSRFVFIPGHVYVQIWLPKAMNRYKTEDDWITVDAVCKTCDFGELIIQNLGKEKSYLGG
ncbi:transglutaminase-like domain-containing protein [Candidatus Woesearchaeota archaeon]|nr:transglutaminase-like domain-containing protein [Candidatus Woesearchaeota archaeon]